MGHRQCGELRRNPREAIIGDLGAGSRPSDVQQSKMVDLQSSSASSPPDRNSDTGFVPGDDTWTQWRNIFSILTGKMTDEGKEQFRVARDVRNEAADCKRCEDQRDFLLQYSE